MKKIYMINNNSENCFCVKHQTTARKMVNDLNQDYRLSFNSKKNPFSYEEYPVAKTKNISSIEKTNGMWYSPKGYMFKKNKF